MKRAITLGTLFALACVLIVSLPASAAPKIGAKDNGFSITDEHYLRTYVQCWAELKDQCGRNIVDDGLANGDVPTKAKVQASTATMDRWLHPVVQAPIAESSPAPIASAPTTTVAPTSAGGCVGMEAESGSAGYAATPGGPYIGCYQIGVEHYAAGGSCAGLGTDPAGQDACAANICATEGAGAWTNPAGENPCGRLP